jgi:4-hydroxy-2-oxoheptanedioate aldolase
MRDLFQPLGSDARPPLGTWLKSTSIESVEIMAYAGFDFVIIDMEHAPLALPNVYAHIVTASARVLAPLVRVPDHGAATIARVLDSGAAGILAPHVDDAEQAGRVAACVRFPPHGHRGSGGTSRAARWGLLGRSEYLRFGNQEALCIAQLESRVALENAASILDVPGIDGVFVGAADLALETGLAATDPELVELIDGVLLAGGEAGKPVGWAVGSSPDAARAAYARGFGFVVMGNDLSMLAERACSLVEAARRDPSAGPGQNATPHPAGATR